MIKKVCYEGAVRVDLLGGTIDIPPIGLILKNAVTLNVATGLKTKVTIEESSYEGVTIESLDYKKRVQVPKEMMNEKVLFYTEKYRPFHFVLQVLHFFKLTERVKVEFSSNGIPTGAGLGGSSAMGVVLAKGILKYLGKEDSLNPKEIVKIVSAIESRILKSGPVGFQDYFPALYGGILALRESPTGIEIEQLYNEELKEYLKKHLLLVYSGKTRLSGINNWEVFKGFFDGKKKMTQGLGKLATLSYKAYESIFKGDYKNLWKLIRDEGKNREGLFKNILTKEMKKIQKDLLKEKINGGIKVCGAGGGGCFIIAHDGKNQDKVLKIIGKNKMTPLNFDIEAPR